MISSRVKLAEIHCLRFEVPKLQCEKLIASAKINEAFDVNILRTKFKLQHEIKSPTSKDPNAQNAPSEEPRPQEEPTAGSLSFFKLLEFGELDENREALANEEYGKAYAQFKELKDQLEIEHIEIFKAKHNLGKFSTSPLALVRALFMHEGWVDLIGNIAIFILFSIFIEARLGAGLSFFIYFIGGGIGMFVQAKFAPHASAQLLGSSLCVSSILGASLVLFWRQKMKLWFSFIFYNRVWLVPSLIVIPIFASLHNFANNFGTGLQVAHLAYIVSFALGMLLAKLFDSIAPIPKHFVFAEEYRLYRVFRSTEVFKKRIYALQRLLYLNPDNSYALQRAADWIKQDLIVHYDVLKEYIGFLSQTMGEHIRFQLESKSPEDMIQFLAGLSDRLIYTDVFKHVPLSVQLEVQNEWISNRKFALCLSESFSIESKLSAADAHFQFDKIISSIDLETTKISEPETKRIIEVYEHFKKLYPDHVFVKKLEVQIKRLKVRDDIQAA